MKKFRIYRINSPKIIHETIDGETVIVNLDSGNYYSIEGVGGEIWDLIARAVPEETILETLSLRYAGQREDMRDAVHRFVDELQREGLISAFESEEDKADTLHNEESAIRSEELICFEAPVLNRYTDMQEVLLLDPIHDVDETGWPSAKSDPAISEK